MKKKLIVIAIALSSITSSYAVICPIDPATPKTKVKDAFRKHTSEVVQALKSASSQLSDDLDEQTAHIKGAITVMVAQEAMAGEALNTAIKDQSKGLAESIVAVNQAERIRQVRDELYSEEATGYNVCMIKDEQEKAHQTLEQARDVARVTTHTQITARAGAYANKPKATNVRLKVHDSHYCTADQEASGLCTVGDRAGKSLEASSMFEFSERGTDKYADKVAFINNIVGLPDNTIQNQGEINSARGDFYRENKRQKDAVKSPALVSLATIAELYSVPTATGTLTESDIVGSLKEDKVASSATKPVMWQVKEAVGRYSGGSDEHKNWSAYLVKAEDKGVMIEELKIRALRLHMQALKYESLNRQEAMLASLVSAQIYNSGMAEQIKDFNRQAVYNAMN